MQNKVEICGVNTAKLKVLKHEETQRLLRQAKEGDEQARQELIAGNLRLVLSVIQKFANRGENVDDLFQVGCIGLIKAIDNFNTDLDVRFSTYGVPMTISCRKIKYNNLYLYDHELCEFLLWIDVLLFSAQYLSYSPTYLINLLVRSCAF